MKNASYLSTEFGEDLAKLCADIPGSIKDRVSVVYLLPSSASLDPTRTHIEAFQRLPHKQRFLFCFFLVSLLDQATHCRAESLHPIFDATHRCPKICGILGSYWSILHPSTILSVASLWHPDVDDAEIISISDHFWTEYVRQSLSPMGEANGHFDPSLDLDQLITAIESEMLVSTQSWVPGLRPYSTIEPDVQRVRHWLDIFHKSAQRFSDLRPSPSTPPSPDSPA